MRYIFPLIILSILFLLLSCKTTIKVDLETQRICEQNNYDGDYIFEAWQKERDGDEKRMGQVHVVIEKCVLSVKDLYGADLMTDNIERWKGLNGVVDKRGRVSGQVAMDTCFVGDCGIEILSFYGQIEKEALLAKLSYYDVVISLRKDAVKYADIPKIGISQEISPLPLKDKPQSIVIPVASIGNVPETRKMILQNSLEDELKEYFIIISQDRFEEAQEKAFEELDFEECTEDQCIMLIQEILQVENVFHLEVIGEGKNTQLSLSWKTLDQNQKETDVCIDCDTFKLNEKIKGLLQKLIKK